MRRISRRLGALVAVMTLGCLGPGCGGKSLPTALDAGRDSAAPPPDGAASRRFALGFFGQRLGVIYDYAKLESATAALKQQDALVTITEEDVDAYRIGTAPSSRIALRLTAAATKKWSGSLPALSETQPFVVSLDGARLYVGVVYVIGGAAAIQTPVLHIGDEAGQTVLKIGSHQGAWMGWGTGNASRIDRQELRDLFTQRGVLTGLGS